MTNWTQQLREAYHKLKEGHHDDIQAARLQRTTGIDLGIRKVMPEQEGLTPAAIEAQKRRMAQQQEVIDRLEGRKPKTMSEDVTLGRVNLSTLGRSVKQGLEGLGRRLVGKGGRQSTLGKQYPPTGLKLYTPNDPYIAEPLTNRVPNISALPKGMFAEPDLSKPHLSGNRPTEHEKAYWADLRHPQTMGENGTFSQDDILGANALARADAAHRGTPLTPEMIRLAKTELARRAKQKGQVAAENLGRPRTIHPEPL